MESIIGPLVAAFAANSQYNDEVVTYDDLIDDHHQAMLDDVEWTFNYAAKLREELDNA